MTRKAKRNAVVRSFSFQPEDIALLEQAKGRVSRLVPEVNNSEAVRMALEVMALAPEGLLRRVASTFDRSETGRPPTILPPSSMGSAWEEEFLEDEGRLRRLALFEELEMLREGPRGDPAVEERIETLCRYFGMVNKR